MWRTTYDVKDKWTSKYDNNGGIGVLRSAHQNEALGPFVGPGRWNDLDMLQVGVDGFDYGHDRKKAGFDITPDEERLQMSLWSILASPLLTANDVTAMNDQTKAILLNKEIIAINPLYRERYAGIDPLDLKTPADFAALPTLSKQDLRERSDELVSDGYDREKMFHKRIAAEISHTLVQEALVFANDRLPAMQRYAETNQDADALREDRKSVV